MLVISNLPRATRSADLKSLARLFPELYSTQSYYHYLLQEREIQQHVKKENLRSDKLVSRDKERHYLSNIDEDNVDI